MQSVGGMKGKTVREYGTFVQNVEDAVKEAKSFVKFFEADELPQFFLEQMDYYAQCKGRADELLSHSLPVSLKNLLAPAAPSEHKEDCGPEDRQEQERAE